MVRQRIDLDDVLEQTALLVDEGGRESLSLGRLAERLGVQPSALYNHVDGVDGLWHEFAVHATNRLADVLLESAVARSAAPALQAVATAYREFAHRHPGQFASSLLPPSSAEDSLTESHARIASIFIRVVASFGIDGDERIHVARMVRSAIHGFVALEAIDGMPSPQERATSFDGMVAFLVDGIQRRRPAG